jgi:hypothetical protein
MPAVPEQATVPAQWDFQGTGFGAIGTVGLSATGALTGLMKWAIAQKQSERIRMSEEQKPKTDRFASTLAIAASVVAAVRLAPDQETGKLSSCVFGVVSDSIILAGKILERIVRGWSRVDCPRFDAPSTSIITLRAGMRIEIEAEEPPDGDETGVDECSTERNAATIGNTTVNLLLLLGD